MSLEMNWMNFEIDHVEPISPFDVSNDEEIEETFILKINQP